MRRWLETESYVGEVWDGLRPLERERYRQGGFYDEGIPLSWKVYLQHTVCAEGEVKKALDRLSTIQQAVAVQAEVRRLVDCAGHCELPHLFNLMYQTAPHVTQIIALPALTKEEIEANLNTRLEEVEGVRRRLNGYLGDTVYNQDKVLVVDLLSLVVDDQKFSLDLLYHVGNRSLEQFREAEQAKWSLSRSIKPMARELFHDLVFASWRQENETGFLKEKRELERQLKKSAKPYLDYLDEEEGRQFALFWAAHGDDILLWVVRGSGTEQNAFSEHFLAWHQELNKGAHTGSGWYAAYRSLRRALLGLPDDVAHQYLASMRRFEDLNQPLHGQYRCLRTNAPQQKHLAAAFRTPGGFGYGRSQVYRQSASQGSVFKLVTAYAALIQKTHLPQIIDDAYQYNGQWYVGKFLDGTPIPQNFKGGRLPRTMIKHVGEVDLVRAFEFSSNAYFSLLTSEVLKRPMDLADAAYQFSYGSKTGIDLPGEISGEVPNDLDQERTGLYTFAIGQHTLVVTPLQTAVMLSTIANGGDVVQPRVGNYLAGTSVNKLLAPPWRHLPIGSYIRTPILEGMMRVAHRYQTNSIWSLKQHYQNYPEATGALESLKGQLAGKTSTAESVEVLSPDRPVARNTYNHLWFGGITFEQEGHTHEFKDDFGRPELVVVVYLRYGAYGRDAAPVAAQIATKWREIKARRARGE